MYLYVHIPFCSKRCDYCDFVAFENQNMQDEYVNTMLKEIKILSSEYPAKLKSLYLGGGTPSLLSIENLYKIINSIYKEFSVPSEEITMELNPEDVDFEKFSAIKTLGVNRLSMGVQSFSDEVLETLGRVGSYDDSLNSYRILREIGYENINLDLIYGVPNSSFSDVERSVDELISLKPEHISTYSLIVSRGTKLYSKVRKGELKLADDDRIADEFDLIVNKLKENGYDRYEISNFSLPKFQSIHNNAYWQTHNTLGLGIASVYKINSFRYENTYSYRKYIEYINKGKLAFDRKIKINITDAINEKIMLGFRLAIGISILEFKSEFGFDILSKYSKQIEKYRKLNMLKIENGRIFLTNAGMNVSNTIICDFLI